ncbi:hypothetical protein JOC69_003331 [Heliobacterium gestii]|nr:hypothetical protein [Heliomicrobium gestii]
MFLSSRRRQMATASRLPRTTAPKTHSSLKEMFGYRIRASLFN